MNIINEKWPIAKNEWFKENIQNLYVLKLSHKGFLITEPKFHDLQIFLIIVLANTSIVSLFLF